MSRNHVGTVNARAQAAFRKAVLQHFGYRCQECGILGGRLEAHHVIALVSGGSNDLSNAMLYCRDCHIRVHLPAVDPDVAAWSDLVTELLAVKAD